MTAGRVRARVAKLRDVLGGIFNSGKRSGFAAAELGARAVRARVSVHRHGFGGAGGGGAGVGADAQLPGVAASLRLMVRRWMRAGRARVAEKLPIRIIADVMVIRPESKLRQIKIEQMVRRSWKPAARVARFGKQQSHRRSYIKWRCWWRRIG